jgi:hypothetical protein
MDPDVALTLAVLNGMFAVPATVSALSDLRRPYLGIGMLAASAALVLYATQQTAEPYTLDRLPDVLLTVIGRLIN